MERGMGKGEKECRGRKEKACVTPIMEKVQETHDAITNHAGAIGATHSKLARCVSMHYACNPVSFNQIGKFLDHSIKVFRNKRHYNMGTLSGEIIVSVNLANSVPQPDTTSTLKSKRSFDDSHERAKQAVDQARKILKRGSASVPVDEEHLTYAQGVIERMFRDLRGSNGELVLESLGLSIAPSSVMRANTSNFNSQPNSSPPMSPTNFSTRPQFILACRLSGGIAVPLYMLKSILSTRDGTLFDGLVTTKVDSLGPEYRLPLSQLGSCAASKGQQSFLLFAAIPKPPDTNRGNGVENVEGEERPSKIRRV